MTKIKDFFCGFYNRISWSDVRRENDELKAKIAILKSKLVEREQHLSELKKSNESICKDGLEMQIRIQELKKDNYHLRCVTERIKELLDSDTYVKSLKELLKIK